MPSYRFKFYDPNSRSEKLGAAVLADDDEALSFAKRVVRELIHSDEKLYATWKVELTARGRKVADMPFAPEGPGSREYRLVIQGTRMGAG